MKLQLTKSFVILVLGGLYLLGPSPNVLIGQEQFPTFKSHPTWSNDGTFIAFAGSDEEQSDIWIIGIGENLPLNLTSDFQSNEFSPIWSPDGRWIAFVSDHDGQDDIWIMDTEGKQRRNLTDINIYRVEDPVWSPDGNYIAYLARAAEIAAVADLWLVDPDTSEAKNLTQDTEHRYYDFAWSPDSSTIIAGSRNPPRENVLELIAVESGQRQQIRSGESYYFLDWSPVDQLVSYLNLNLADVFSSHVQILNLTTLQIELDLPPKSSHAKWSPDGDKLAVITTGESTGDELGLITNNPIWLLDMETQETTALIDSGWNTGIEWSPDGRALAFVSNLGQENPQELNIWVVDIQNGNLVKLTNPPEQ